MAATEITAAFIMLILMWFSIRKFMTTDKLIMMIVWFLVGVFALLSYTGNSLGYFGILGWGVGIIGVIVLVKWIPLNSPKPKNDNNK